MSFADTVAERRIIATIKVEFEPHEYVEPGTEDGWVEQRIEQIFAKAGDASPSVESVEVRP